MVLVKRWPSPPGRAFQHSRYPGWPLDANLSFRANSGFADEGSPDLRNRTLRGFRLPGRLSPRGPTHALPLGCLRWQGVAAQSTGSAGLFRSAGSYFWQPRRRYAWLADVQIRCERARARVSARHAAHPRRFPVYSAVEDPPASCRESRFARRMGMAIKTTTRTATTLVSGRSCGRLSWVRIQIGKVS